MNRELGISEKIVWLLSEAGCNNFVIIAKIKGLLSETVLHQSLLNLQKRHPILNVRIKLSGAKPLFVSDKTPEIPLRIVESTNTDDWIEQANKEMNLPFDWEKGPLVRLIWLKSEQESTILVSFHHVIGDAFSGTYFVRDLLSISNELISDGVSNLDVSLPERLASDELIPSDLQGIKGAFNSLGGGLRQGLMFAKQPKKIPPDKEVPAKEVRTCVIHRTLSPEITQLMVERSRKESTSVHGLICAMMLKAVAAKIQDNNQKKNESVNLGCFSTVNLRNFLIPKIGEEIGLYASGISTFHQLCLDTPTWDLAREVKTNLSRLLDKGEAFATLMLQKNLLNQNLTPLQIAQRANQFFLSATCVTNLGVVNIPQKYGNLELKSIHFCVAGNAFPGGGIGIAATTFNGQAVFNYLFGSPLMTAENAKVIVDNSLETLHNAIGTA